MRARATVEIGTASGLVDNGEAWGERLFVEYGTEASIMACETSAGIVEQGEPYFVIGAERGTTKHRSVSKLRAVRPKDARAFAYAILKAYEDVEAWLQASPKVVPLVQPKPKRAAKGAR